MCVHLKFGPWQNPIGSLSVIYIITKWLWQVTIIIANSPQCYHWMTSKTVWWWSTLGVRCRMCNCINFVYYEKSWILLTLTALKILLSLIAWTTLWVIITQSKLAALAIKGDHYTHEAYFKSCLSNTGASLDRAASYHHIPENFLFPEHFYLDYIYLYLSLPYQL